MRRLSIIVAQNSQRPGRRGAWLVNAAQRIKAGGGSENAGGVGMPFNPGRKTLE
jgi:hypothetical protein